MANNVLQSAMMVWFLIAIGDTAHAQPFSKMARPSISSSAPLTLARSTTAKSSAASVQKPTNGRWR